MRLLRAHKAGPGWIGPRRGDAPGPARAGELAAAGPVGSDSRLQATLSRGLAVALWLAIGLALLLGLLNLSRGGAAPPAPAAGPAAAQPAAPPGGCAELLVAGWLAGDSRLVASLAAVPGGATGGASGLEREAVRIYTAGTAPAADQRVWGYLVAAEVRERPAGAEAWQDLGVQFFRVTMLETGAAPGCHGWVPAALPMQVPAPSPAAAASLPYPVPLATSDTELSRTLAAFLAGMLTGAGDVERYLAPGAAIAPIVPPPYAEVSLTDLRGLAGAPRDGVPPDGTVVRVLATVAVDRAALPLVYPVTVAVRGGRWEVLAVDPFVGATPASMPLPGPEE